VSEVAPVSVETATVLPATSHPDMCPFKNRAAPGSRLAVARSRTAPPAAI
jgi:hypothetical protein